MRAFVMAAGRGTRLAPFTDYVPKPALPVANEPVMSHLLRLLARHGIRDIIANSSYLAELLETIIGDGAAQGVHLTWIRESEPLGTAGGLRNAEHLLRDGDEPVVILSGDGLHDIDLTALIAAHRSNRALVTMALTQVQDASQYGVVVCNDAGWVTEFQEKPAAGTELSNLANTGVYVIDPSVFDRLPPAGTAYEIGPQLLPSLVLEGPCVLGVTIEGYWNDIGGHESFRAGSFALLDGNLDSVVEPEDSMFGNQVMVHPSANLEDDVRLTGPCVVGAGATVGSGSRLVRSVVLPGTSVPAGSLLADSTIGSASGLTEWANEFGERL